MANRIRAERAQIKVSQEQLANLLGVTRPTISAWEDEISDIPSSAVRTLSEYFNCTSDWLLGISDSKKPA